MAVGDLQAVEWNPESISWIRLNVKPEKKLAWK